MSDPAIVRFHPARRSREAQLLARVLAQHHGDFTEPTTESALVASLPPCVRMEAQPVAAPWADYGRLAELGSLQPLTALGAAIPGVATWKPGAYSPLVRVRGTVASAGWLGEILLLLLQEDADANGRMVGLMLKPRCGLDALRALVGARCPPAPARSGSGKLPLKEYRRQQRQAAQADALRDGSPAADEDEAALPGEAQVHIRLEVEAFVEKSKVQFLLRNAPLRCNGGAGTGGHSGVLPVVLHPANARWSPAGADSVGTGSGGAEDGDTFCEWQECGLEPSGVGSDWTPTGETRVQAIGLDNAYLGRLRAHPVKSPSVSGLQRRVCVLCTRLYACTVR